MSDKVLVRPGWLSYLRSVLPSFSRARALIVTGLGAAVLAATVGVPVAQAAPTRPAAPAAPAAPLALRGASFTAFADVGMATLDIPALSPAILPQTNVDLTRSTADADSERAVRTSGESATTGSSSLLGQALDIQSVRAEAPPSSTDEATLIPLDLSPLANIPIITTTAAANWISDAECVASDVPLSDARAFVADADVVQPDPATSIISIDPSGGALVDTRGTTGLPANGGPNDQRSVSATVVPEIGSVNVLNGLAPGIASLITVEIQNDPSYTAIASGIPGGADVIGVDPILDVTIGGTSLVGINRNTVPADGVVTDLTLADLFTGTLLTDLVTDVFGLLSIPVPPNPLTDPLGVAVVQILDTLSPIVELSIPYTETIAADGTSASVTTDLLRVDVLAPTLTPSPLDPIAVAVQQLLAAIGAAPGQALATVELAPMEAAVTMSAGGLFCGDDDNPLEVNKVNSGPAVPGSSFDYTIAVGNVGECAMDPVRVVDVVEGPAGTTIGITEPAGATVTDLGSGDWRIEWANVGPIAPDGRTTLRVRVNVGANAPVGERFTDTVTSTASIASGPGCTPRDVTRTVVLPEPEVVGRPSGPCNITGSTKGKSHLQVYPGESFVYYVNVLNGGGEPCTNVTVVDPIDSRLTFESCSDGCTFTAPNASWNIGTLAPGQSVTLRLQVKVNDGATGTLANTATIDSAETPPTNVSVSGPDITTNSEQSPGNPARIPNRDLARTGGPSTIPAPVLLALGLAAVGAWNLRRRLAD
jgi:uncharacterized repeat protein (TIGR01451 family)